MTNAAVAGAFALVTVTLTAPVVLWIVKERVLDIPNPRSSHDEPTPRGGGLSLVAGCVIGLLVLDTAGFSMGWGVLFVAGSVGIVGLADDLWSIPNTTRLLVQVVAAGVCLIWLLDDFSGSTAWRLVFGVGVAIWITGYTNAFNFMDGINGIAGAQLIVAGAAMAVVGAAESIDVLTGLGVVTVCAALGFLPWNFPRARFFMGDVGSYFGGAWLASLAVVALRLDLHPVLVVAPLALFLVDTSLTLVRRISRGEVWYRAHRSHIYQRTVATGWSHVRVTLTYTGLSALIVIGSLAWLYSGTSWRVLGSAIAMAAAAMYVALPTLAERTAAP